MKFQVTRFILAVSLGLSLSITEASAQWIQSVSIAGPFTAATRVLFPSGCNAPGQLGNPFHSGNGTNGSPYLICDANDLMNINNSPTFLDDVFELGDDIDMTGQSFLGIGDSANPFTGELRGDDRSIINMTISNGSGLFVGLFNVLGDGAIVRDVDFINASVLANLGAGILAGRAATTPGNSVLIDNCTSSGSSAANVSQAGGLVGSISGEVQLLNSYSDASVSAGNTAGGLVGSATGAFVIEDSSYSGTLNSSSTSTYGGIVGSASIGLISRTFSSGSITGNQDVGGLVGNGNSATIDQSFSTMAINGVRHIAGLVGAGSSMAVLDSYATGNIGCQINCGGLANDDEDNIFATNTYQRVYATGQVMPLDDLFVCFAHNPESGALFGHLNPVGSSVVNAYWNTETSGQCTANALASPFTDVGVGLTSAQMGIQSNFSGFNFASVWTMPAGGPPILQWQP